MRRAVFDTNVVVSALIGQGKTSELVGLWKERRVLPLVCKETAEELLRVLAYPKFHLSSEEVKSLFERHYLAYAETVRIKEIPRVVEEDPSDDVFLACALCGKADVLVSGDSHLLKLKRYRKIPIVSVVEFLATASAA